MQSLCNQDVLTMLGGGLDADIVIETIRVQTLMELKKSGVPAAVIKEWSKGIENRLAPADGILRYGPVKADTHNR